MAEHSIFLQELQPPAFIGESAVTAGGLRNASVVARSVACALRLAAADALFYLPAETVARVVTARNRAVAYGRNRLLGTLLGF